MGKGEAWITDYGMAWRPKDASAITQVRRTASFGGRAVLTVWAQHPATSIDSHPGIEITVSKGGRSIRVWDRKSNQEMRVGPDNAAHTEWICRGSTPCKDGNPHEDAEFGEPICGWAWVRECD